MKAIPALVAVFGCSAACELITGVDDLTIRTGVSPIDASTDGEDGSSSEGNDATVADAGGRDASGGDDSSFDASDARDSATEDVRTSDASDSSTSDVNTTDAADAAGDGNDGAPQNPCVNFGCDPKATCTMDAGVTCNCPAGYNTPDNGHTCVDINECLTSPCGSGTCANQPGSYSCSCPVGGCKMVYSTAGNYNFRVPAGVSTIDVELWGAGGGASVGNNVFGGAGGYTTGSIAVLPGATLNVLVGAGGGAGVNGGNTGTSLGGGGIGANYGGGGGGRSEVGVGSTPYLIAGGGGGAGYSTSNVTGAGGGQSGVSALTNCGGGGQGGTQNAGGAPGPGGTAGSSGTGGNATTTQSGGGGGGYFGGGGGGSSCGGGGGSGYVRASAPLFSGTTTAGNADNPAGTSSTHYATPAGRGGSGPKFTSVTNAGIDGRVVIIWQ